MMYARTQKKTWKAVLVLLTGAALALLFRRFLAPTLTLTAGAAALAFLLCPVCRRLEKHMRPGLAAAGCLLGALLSLAALLWLLAPALLSSHDLAGGPARGAGGFGAARGSGLGAWARELGLDAQLPQLDLRGLGDGALRFAAGTVAFAGGVVNAVSQISMAAVLERVLLIDRKTCFCGWNCVCRFAFAPRRCAWRWRRGGRCACICGRRPRCRWRWGR